MVGTGLAPLGERRYSATEETNVTKRVRATAVPRRLAALFCAAWCLAALACCSSISWERCNGMSCEDEDGVLIQSLTGAVVPGAHPSQATAPSTAVCRPFGQLVQARPSVEYVPALQSLQDAAPAGAAVPGAHPSHATAPAAAACRPSGQLVQFSAALALA